MPTTRKKAVSSPVAETEPSVQLLPQTISRVDFEPEHDPDSEESVLDRLRSMGGEDRDRMRVKIYRKTAAGALEWCTDYTVGEWEEGDVSRVRADWGSGTYEMRVVSSGRRGILLRDVFRIASDAKPAILNPAPVPQATGLEEVVRMLAEGQQRILEAVSQRPDPAAQLQATLGLMAAMREAMGLNAPPPPPPPASDPGAMLGQLVGAIRQLREVATEVSPPAPDTDNPLAMFGQVVDIVKLGMAQRQGGIEPVALPGSIQAAPAQVQPNPEPQEENDMGILVLHGQLAQLVKMAAAGESPEKGGEFVADNLPDELLGYLDLPNILDILARFNSDVKKHPEWFEAAKNHAVKLLAEDDAPDQSVSGP